jgi:hypothetical protein
MKILQKLLTISLLFCVLFGVINCNSLNKAVSKINLKPVINSANPELDSLARNATRNAVLGASDNAKLLTQNLIRGLKGSMDTLNPDIQKIMKTIDSLGKLSDKQLNLLGNSLNNQIGKLKDNIKDEELKKFLVSTIEQATGTLQKSTKNMLSNIIQTGLDSLSGNSSKEKITKIIQNILGDSTKKQVQLLVSSALQPTMDSLFKRIDKLTEKDIPFVQKQASKLLWSLGILASGIIGFVWYQRRKYAKLVQLMTYEIHNVPSKDAYDELTTRIKSSAQKESLEPLLKSTLKDQGIN